MGVSKNGVGSRRQTSYFARYLVSGKSEGDVQLGKT